MPRALLPMTTCRHGLGSCPLPAVRSKHGEIDVRRNRHDGGGTGRPSGGYSSRRAADAAAVVIDVGRRSLR